MAARILREISPVFEVSRACIKNSLGRDYKSVAHALRRTRRDHLPARRAQVTASTPSRLGPDQSTEGLNVIEQCNEANDFVFFAKRGELANNRREDHEVSMLSLHLLQNCMMYINTLMMQQILSRPHWSKRSRSAPVALADGRAWRGRHARACASSWTSTASNFLASLFRQYHIMWIS